MVFKHPIDSHRINAAKSAFVFVQLTVKFFLRIVNVKTVFMNVIKVGHVEKFFLLICSISILKFGLGE